ncbi:hypothetical protein M5E88_10225 [Akkermansia muciniphila]|nr:hypothetical protein M5E88_10225 [Akkermansia muciniphila]
MLKLRRKFWKHRRIIWRKNFPGYQVISRATWVFGKKFIDRVRLEKEDDTRVLMFDVSAHINEYRKTHEINLKEIAPGMISVQK